MMNAPVCPWCGEDITPYDRKDPFHVQPTHWECGLRSVVGGLNHQLGKCSCCGGTLDPDPPEMTRREAAQAAACHFLNKHRVTQ